MQNFKKYDDTHIINIKEKEGKIIDFDFYPADLCTKYHWRKASNSDGGIIIKANGSSINAICHCSKDEFKAMKKSDVWRIVDDLTADENLTVRDLTDSQFLQLWKKYPFFRFELLQAAANLSNEKRELYKEYYQENKEVRCSIDEGVAAISATRCNFGYNFIDEVDELIEEQKEWIKAQENKKTPSFYPFQPYQE